MDTGKTGKTALRIVVLACVILVIGVVGLLVVHSRHIAALEALYVDTAQRSQVREYTRAPAPPDWELQSGSASEAYREAWELCEVEPMSHDARLGLNVAVRSLRWDGMDERERQIHARYEAASSAACEPLLLDGDTDDPVMIYLEGSTCERMLHCAPAFDRIVEGSRRRDATSPMAVWSDWRLDEAGTDLRLTRRFAQIGKLQILHAYLLWMAGDREASLDHTFAVLRMDMDVTRGAALDGLVGSSIALNHGTLIRFVLSRPDLTGEEAQRVYAELDHLLAVPVDLGEICQDEFLCVAGGRLGKRDLDLPPGAELWAPSGDVEWKDTIATWRVQREIIEMWPRLWALQAESTTERLAGYREELPEDTPASLVSPGSFIRSLRAMDLRTTFVRAHLALLRLAAADAALLLETGRPPESIEDLRQFDPGIDLVDPFSTRPFVLEQRGDGRYLRSTALDDEESSGLVHLRNHDHPLYLEIRLRDAQEENSDE